MNNTFFMHYLNYLDHESEQIVRHVHGRLAEEGLLKSTLFGMHDKDAESFVALVIRSGILPYLLINGKHLVGFA